MRRRILTIIRFLVMAGLLSISILAAGPSVGEKAPDFNLLNSDNHAVKLADLLGQKKTVLVFFRTLH